MADGATEQAPTGGPSLTVGTRVEARSSLDDSWQTGFVVEEVTALGYRLRRESDGAVLPELPHVRVRRTRTRSTWWI